MTIKGENNIVYDYYDGRVFKIDKETGGLSCPTGVFIFVDTRNRKSFIMRKEYVAVDDNGKEIKCLCKTTHQAVGKSSFGGFGFEFL